MYCYTLVLTSLFLEFQVILSTSVPERSHRIYHLAYSQPSKPCSLNGAMSQCVLLGIPNIPILHAYHVIVQIGLVNADASNVLHPFGRQRRHQALWSAPWHTPMGTLDWTGDPTSDSCVSRVSLSSWLLIAVAETKRDCYMHRSRAKARFCNQKGEKNGLRGIHPQTDMLFKDHNVKKIISFHKKTLIKTKKIHPPHISWYINSIFLSILYIMS